MPEDDAKGLGRSSIASGWTSVIVLIAPMVQRLRSLPSLYGFRVKERDVQNVGVDRERGRRKVGRRFTFVFRSG